MIFLEAVNSGKDFKRPDDDYYYRIEADGFPYAVCIDQDGNEKSVDVIFSLEEMNATNWELKPDASV